MRILEFLSGLTPKIAVLAFGGLIAIVVVVQILSAIDWLWFWPDALPSIGPLPVPGPAPTPAPSDCISMPDGTVVCE